MLAMALKPFGERSLVGLMKLPAALLTRPVSGPLSSQIRCTIASTAAASRMSMAWVLTFPPRDFAVSSRTPPRRPQSHSSAPSSTYFAAISLPRPVPPPVMRMRLPLRRPSLYMRAPGGGSPHSKSSHRDIDERLLPYFRGAQRPFCFGSKPLVPGAVEALRIRKQYARGEQVRLARAQGAEQLVDLRENLAGAGGARLRVEHVAAFAAAAHAVCASAGAYEATPLPNDQFSFATSTRLIQASCGRSPTAAPRFPAMRR